MLRFKSSVVLLVACLFVSVVQAGVHIESYDSENIDAMPFSEQQVLQAHLSLMRNEYSEEKVRERTSKVTERIAFLFQRLREKKRHLIVATDEKSNILGLAWVSNPQQEHIVINQCNAKSPEIAAAFAEHSLRLFSTASTMQLAIRKERTMLIWLLKEIGANETATPSLLLDDDNVDINNELFFEMKTKDVQLALGRLKTMQALWQPFQSFFDWCLQVKGFLLAS